MTTDIDISGERWRELESSALTPADHAYLMAARTHATQIEEQLPHTPGWHKAAVDAHDVLVAGNAFNYLNKHTASAIQIVSLDMVKWAGDGGLYARRLDGTVRGVLIRRGWVATTGTNARDWAANLHLTFDGRAQLEAGRLRPVELTPELAFPLQRILRDGPTDNWVGHGWAERVAKFWVLVTTEGQLTKAGREAVERFEGSVRIPDVPSAAQNALLAELVASNTVTRTAMHNGSTYDACERNGWIRWGLRDEHGRSPLFITAAGREAHARFQGGVRTPSNRTKRIKVSELRSDMVVRLANRAGYRVLGPQWVTVDHVERLARQGHAPGGYVVWIKDVGGAVTAYAQRTAFHRNVKFEVRPETSPRKSPPKG